MERAQGDARRRLAAGQVLPTGRDWQGEDENGRRGQVDSRTRNRQDLEGHGPGEGRGEEAADRSADGSCRDPWKPRQEKEEAGRQKEEKMKITHAEED